jgi:phage tail P2-like protein
LFNCVEWQKAFLVVTHPGHPLTPKSDRTMLPYLQAQLDQPRAFRSLIANSVQIHKTKGTVSAIERVMDALGVTAELREWFEYNGQPHTFHLTAELC